MSSIPPSLKEQVILRSQNRCCYCQSQQQLMGVSLTIDHIIPQSLGGETSEANLCQACWDCNLAKSDQITALDAESDKLVRLFHPWQQAWSDHFRWHENGCYILGLTPTGRATIIALKLNRPQLVEARRYWVQAGWHPPDSK